MPPQSLVLFSVTSCGDITDCNTTSDDEFIKRNTLVHKRFYGATGFYGALNVIFYKIDTAKEFFFFFCEYCMTDEMADVFTI